MKRPYALLNTMLVVLLFASIHVQSAGAETKLSQPLKTSGFQHAEGFFDFYWDDSEGKIWLQIAEFDEPFLYVSSLATGLGSNPVGLDRGQLGDSRVVRFKRVGKRVYLIQLNLKYRASTDNEAERNAIRDSFAESILWSGELRTDENGQQLVDLTDFLLRDAHNCIGTLASSGQGTFTLDSDRCFVHLPRTKAFPRNTEFESALTFASKKPGQLARRAAADGRSITLRQHHSFVQLPDAGYKPRRFDPRVGCFAIDYADYGVPIDQPLQQRLITRHRLNKERSGSELGPAITPIIYYVDPGVPQPVRDALVQGASWWEAAFVAAGFEDAFQVRILPDDADPMDVRYNVIQWVHRATRGWSYGQSVVDPRTGEIIKGHVLLGSLRVRQDHLLFEGLDPPTGDLAGRACSCGLGYVPDEAYLSQLDPNLSSVEVALARIRQLSAHEVGHTLGFAHNFAASTYGDRASVMDYPAPRAKITDGQVDLSDAYGVGIGEWDKFTVQYAYSQFPEGQEQVELNKLIASSIAKKMLYVTDPDARPAGAAHPLGNLWDNGSDPIDALRHEMEVRRIALSNFGDKSLADGQALSELEKSLVPVYLHHRYQVDATAKVLGGYQYSYAVKGDGQIPQIAIPSELQRQALDALLKTIEPGRLVISQRILDLIPPRVGVSASDRERFSSQTSPIFDPVTAMRTAADLTLGNLLQPQRASRLARIDDENWGLSTVIDIVASTMIDDLVSTTAADAEARRIVQGVFVEKLVNLAGEQSASHDARAIALDRLRHLRGNFKQASGRLSRGKDKAHYLMLIDEIERFLNRPAAAARPAVPIAIPPGSPIGSPNSTPM